MTQTHVEATSHSFADPVSVFLWDEAFLLDHRRYDEWLDLWGPDGVYWAPIVPGSDPDLQVSLIYDDMQTLRKRIEHLLSPDGWVQVPPSSVMRTVSNIRVTEVAGSRVDVRSVELVVESRWAGSSYFGRRTLNTSFSLCRMAGIGSNGRSWSSSTRRIRCRTSALSCDGPEGPCSP